MGLRNRILINKTGPGATEGEDSGELGVPDRENKREGLAGEGDGNC